MVIMGEISIPVPENHYENEKINTNKRKLRLGTLFTREQLYNQWIHTHQRRSLAYDPYSQLTVSMVFGFCDEFGPCTRLWSTNNNKNYITALVRSGYYSTPIRIIIDTNNCMNALDINKTKQDGEISWVESANLKKDQEGGQYYMYVGIMYVASYFYKNQVMYFQLADEPPPTTWKEIIFVNIAKELNIKLE